MWQDSLKDWSQTAYGLIHSVATIERIDLGNINRIGDSIVNAFDWLSRRDEFASSVAQHRFDEHDFRLDDGDVDEIVRNLKRNLLSLLFVDLAALADGLLASMMDTRGLNPADHPYLANKVNAVDCASAQEWARSGMLELNVVRNCFVHSRGTWNARSLDDLARVVPSLTAKVGDPVMVNYEDRFRYKRAVRTLLNQADTHGFV